MSGITLLFLVWSSPETRAAAKAEWITFKSCLAQWGFVLARLTERWNRMARPKEVLVKLADATVEAMERDFVSRSDEGQRRKRARDQDRRRSIMEQLGSPGISFAFQPFDLSTPTVPSQAVPQFSWAALKPSDEAPQGFNGVDPAMLADEIWPCLGPYDNAGVLGGFGLFEYFPMGVDDVEMQGQGMAARADGAVTDSVLNFRESWEEEGGGGDVG
ncbi:hypothetical protein QQZ08_002688 [Neonectria magnoliae]|uniref:Uncharacterized protein n=1 Tax=Neonectria magnoliae TaxID=2732573 RepID=A0ABR1IAS8_9HYPO